MNDLEVHIRAARGISILRERLKSVAREHSERIKQLSALMQDVEHGFAKGQKELFTSGLLSLSPETQKLLENPVHGL